MAWEALLRVETQGAHADEWLHARLADPGIKREDAALATELVMGALRWQRLLDFLLEPQLTRKPAQAAARPDHARPASAAGRRREAARQTGERRVAEPGTPAVARLDAEVRAALRLGLYQLRWLQRVPARAAVHESVELVKRARKASAAGLVNAVLRRLAAQAGGSQEQLVPREWPLAERLAVLGSHPTWLVERWLAALGEEETRALLAANNSPPRVTCAVAAGERPQTVIAELKNEGVEARPGRWLRDALEVLSGAVGRTRACAEGRVRIQDEASQMAALLPAAQPGMRVLDVCAAPGGKTLLLAEAVGPSGSVVAADLHASRLRALRERVARSPQVQMLAMDASAAEWPLRAEFDAILVDVPCSGTGTLARHPEIRWRLRAEDLAELRARQTAILLNSAARLRPRGRLVYSTCSLEPEENEQVVEAVLEQRPELRLVSGEETLVRHLQTKTNGRVARPAPTRRALFDERGFFRTWPQRHGTDGFFAAVLEQERG
jgi:16S rRNA (cytosine967-C5)-methyltransferase